MHWMMSSMNGCRSEKRQTLARAGRPPQPARRRWRADQAQAQPKTINMTNLVMIRCAE